MNNQKGFAHLLLIVGIVTVLSVGGLAYYRVTNNTSQENQNVNQSTETDIKSFADCVAAGNPIMESNPEQCMAGDELFLNKITEEEANESDEDTSVAETKQPETTQPAPIPTTESNPPYETQKFNKGLNSFANSTAYGIQVGWEPYEIGSYDGFKVVYSTTNSKPTVGVDESRDFGPTHRSLVFDHNNGKTWYYRVCAMRNNDCFYSELVSAKAPNL